MVYEKLLRIQTELIATKNMYNKFGNYAYRNLEGICESVKPLLKELKCVLILDDAVEQVGDRYYINATATLLDTEDGTKATCTARAREEESKKGMDSSQLTGATSSYARKYAVAGLFLLDDNKDMDSNEIHSEIEGKLKTGSVADSKISKLKAEALKTALENGGVSLEKIYVVYNVTKLEDLTEKQHAEIIDTLNKKEAKAKANASEAK